MIIVLSGQPGNGKTLKAMSLAEAEHQRNADAVKRGAEPPRRFFSNIKGACIEDNPLAFPWMEKMPEHLDWTKLPDHSYVLYDEAHSDGVTPGLEDYGVLFPATGRPGESEDHRIKSMSTHRHRGFDLVLMTQWPNKIHHNIRPLVGSHVHMNRAMGLQRAGVLTWTRCQPDPYDEKQREKAEEEIWVYPKHLYTRYISSTHHTASYKFKVPKKAWQALSMFLTAAAVAWVLWHFVFKPDRVSKPEKEIAAEEAQAQAPQGAGAPPASSSDEKIKWSTTAEYAAAHVPRFPSMPWSAPVYDDREVTVDPQLFCAISHAGIAADGEYYPEHCSCRTEQGTRYDMRDAECRTVALNGTPYNPYKERREERGAPAPSMAVGQTAAPSPAIITSQRQASAYGAAGFGAGERAPVGDFSMR